MEFNGQLSFSYADLTLTDNEQFKACCITSSRPASNGMDRQDRSAAGVIRDTLEGEWKRRPANCDGD